MGVERSFGTSVRKEKIDLALDIVHQRFEENRGKDACL